MRTTALSMCIAVALAGSIAAATGAETGKELPQRDRNEQQPVPPQDTPAVAPKETPPPPSVTIIEAGEAHGVLGREVRSAANENMGRIVDVIVDRSGGVRAAVIDFGGFLGVGSRKIVVDWNALHFGRIADKTDNITLELTKEQVKAAPEYKEDTPIVVLGASGSLKPLQFER